MIRVPEVRLVGENIEPRIYPIAEALKIAQDQQLDLVEISPGATPPVCKIIDYNKFLYDEKKKKKNPSGEDGEYHGKKDKGKHAKAKGKKGKRK